MNVAVTLPTGAQLEITVSPFAPAKALYQAVLEELKGLNLDPTKEIDVNLFKDFFCTGFASKKIEACLWECMKRATYNGLKVSDDTFEPVEAREDYIQVCFEVAKANIAPFLKSLYAQFGPILAKLQSAQA